MEVPSTLKPYGRVYGLYDPQVASLKYIGQTTRALSARLASHVYDKGGRSKSHKWNWVQSLKRDGLRPTIKLIREAWSQEELDRLEEEAIREARARGESLTNIENGGRGRGRVSAETRAKLSAANKGKTYSDEYKKKMSEVTTGKPKAPGFGAQMSAARKGKPNLALQGRTMLPQVREALRRAITGRVKSPEERAKIAAANQGRQRTPEDIAKARATYTANRSCRAREREQINQLSPGDVAAILGVSRWTLQNWDRCGVLNAARTSKNRRYYTRERVAAFLALKAQGTAQEAEGRA